MQSSAVRGKRYIPISKNQSCMGVMGIPSLVSVSIRYVQTAQDLERL